MHWRWLPVARRGGRSAPILLPPLGCPVRWVLLTANPQPLARGNRTLEFAMNIELDEVVVQDVSDDALELAAGGAQGGLSYWTPLCFPCC